MNLSGRVTAITGSHVQVILDEGGVLVQPLKVDASGRLYIDPPPDQREPEDVEK